MCLRLKYSKLYNEWKSIKYNCNNCNSKVYKNYGALGIKVCKEWNKFENFLNWAIENGWDETKYINRKDINKDFEPSNCIVEDKIQYNTINKRDKNHKVKTDNRIYRLWLGMKSRCYNSNNIDYKYYGGRGIKVCKEWLASFNKFEKWAQENGYNDNLTLDRIDVNGNYEPNNCRWATRKEQSNNRRNNHYIVYNGEKYTLTQLAYKFGVKVGTLFTRINNLHWDIQRALYTPVCS